MQGVCRNRLEGWHSARTHKARAYRVQIGRILTEKHRFPEAVEEFTQALRFDLAKAHAHNDLGVALFLLGDYEKAADQFSVAAQIDPSYADARRNLELAQVRLKTEKVENGKK
jgi:tetratricopeptide (TPR) repeat protein